MKIFFKTTNNTPPTASEEPLPFAPVEATTEKTEAVYANWSYSDNKQHLPAEAMPLYIEISIGNTIQLLTLQNGIYVTGLTSTMKKLCCEAVSGENKTTEITPSLEPLTPNSYGDNLQVLEEKTEFTL